MRELLRDVGIGDHEVLQHIDGLHNQTKLTVGLLFKEVGRDPTKSATLATDPSVELEALYYAAFEWRDWKAVALKLQTTRQLGAAQFFQCLISAFLVTKIVRKPLPWDHPTDTLRYA